MRAGLTTAAALVHRWIRTHPAGPPPVVLHLTDGQATDGDPADAAARVRRGSTDRRGALLVNALPPRGRPTLFPSGGTRLRDAVARKMLALSSVLPAPVRDGLRRAGYPVARGARGLVRTRAAAPALAAVTLAALGLGAGATPSARDVRGSAAARRSR